MIGPGTGIAPFRAFLEEREAMAATGDNWLFFGDQHAEHDYLYRDQIEGWTASGLLTRSSFAWSRDTDAKIYVQTLIEAEGAEVFAWLTKGATIFVCGDACRMAADVDRALCTVAETHGAMKRPDAEAFIATLGRDGRYLRDVY